MEIFLMLFFGYALSHIAALTILLIPIYTTNKTNKFFLGASDFKKYFGLNKVGIILFYVFYSITSPLFAIIPYLVGDENVL